MVSTQKMMADFRARGFKIYAGNPPYVKVGYDKKLYLAAPKRATFAGRTYYKEYGGYGSYRDAYNRSKALESMGWHTYIIEYMQSSITHKYAVYKRADPQKAHVRREMRQMMNRRRR